jgi:hypothetical protein
VHPRGQLASPAGVRPLHRISFGDELRERFSIGFVFNREKPRAFCCCGSHEALNGGQVDRPGLKRPAIRPPALDML